jgi:hypothetical protein
VREWGSRLLMVFCHSVTHTLDIEKDKFFRHVSSSAEYSCNDYCGVAGGHE